MGTECSVFKDSQQSQQTMSQSVNIVYENGRFNIPKNIPFNNQSTYTKIQKAAFSFCHQNNIDLDFMPCVTRIIAYRQEKVFSTAFNQTPQNQRQKFMQEINKVPQDQIDLFYHNYMHQEKQKEQIIKSRLKQQILQIPEMKKLKYMTQQQKNTLKEEGSKIISQKKVGLVIMCAGSSSRFNCQDKFLFPLNLKINKRITLLDLIFIRLKKILKNQSVPIIISYNQKNSSKIQAFIRARKFYGFQKIKFRFVEAESLPILDSNGKYCLNEELQLIKRPFGTGRTVIQIMRKSIYNFLKDQEIEYLHFIGAQNLLQQPCDPIMLGLIHSQKKQVVSRCVNPNPWQKLPRYASQLKKQSKVYLKTKQELLEYNDSALSQILPVATNSIIFRFESLQNLMKDYQSDIYLSQNYHILKKQQKVLNINNNKMMQTECLTFEGDIRDLLACFDNTILFRSQRNQTFVPILSLNNQYSLKRAIEFFQQKICQEIKASPILELIN